MEETRVQTNQKRLLHFQVRKILADSFCSGNQTSQKVNLEIKKKKTKTFYLAFEVFLIFWVRKKRLNRWSEIHFRAFIPVLCWSETWWFTSPGGYFDLGTRKIGKWARKCTSVVSSQQFQMQSHITLVATNKTVVPDSIIGKRLNLGGWKPLLIECQSVRGEVRRLVWEHLEVFPPRPTSSALELI